MTGKAVGVNGKIMNKTNESIDVRLGFRQESECFGSLHMLFETKADTILKPASL